MKWIENTNGKPDAILTLSVISLAVVLFKFFFSEISLGPLQMGNLDGGVVTAILAPTLAAYVARRHSDNVTGQNDKDNSNAK